MREDLPEIVAYAVRTGCKYVQLNSNGLRLAEDEEFVPKRAEAGLTGWIDCFEKASLKGTVFGGGVNDLGDIEGHPALQKAYEMGKRIK